MTALHPWRCTLNALRRRLLPHVSAYAQVDHLFAVLRHPAVVAPEAGRVWLSYACPLPDGGGPWCAEFLDDRVVLRPGDGTAETVAYQSIARCSGGAFGEALARLEPGCLAWVEQGRLWAHDGSSVALCGYFGRVPAEVVFQRGGQTPVVWRDLDLWHAVVCGALSDQRRACGGKRE